MGEVGQWPPSFVHNNPHLWRYSSHVCCLPLSIICTFLGTHKNYKNTLHHMHSETHTHTNPQMKTFTRAFSMQTEHTEARLTHILDPSARFSNPQYKFIIWSFKSKSVHNLIHYTKMKLQRQLIGTMMLSQGSLDCGFHYVCMQLLIPTTLDSSNVTSSHSTNQCAARSSPEL